MLGASKATTTREYQLLDTGTITSTGSQSYVIPAGTFYLEIEMWGGGGGGGAKTSIGSGRGATLYSGGGGGGGAYLKKTYYGNTNMQEDDTLNFTVGAGGVSPANPNLHGNDGADTTLDTHKRSTTVITTFTVDAGGGRGAKKAAGDVGVGPNSEAGTATNEGNTTNTDGVAGEISEQTVDGCGSATCDGGDGGAGGNGGAGGAGATTSADAVAGTQPGGGGGGGMPTIKTAGKDGADGKVVVKAYG